MPERVRELIERRSAVAKHFLLDNGQVEAVIHQRPIHYRGPDGAWHDIELVAEDDASVPGFEAIYRRTLVPVRFAKSIKRPWRVELGPGRWISYRAVGGRPARAEVEGAAVTYRGAWDSADLRYTILGHGLKEEIVIRGPEAPAAYVFEVELHGLRLEPDAQGGYLLLAEDGSQAGRLPAPRAVDGAGAEGPASLSHEPAAGTVTLAVDAAWLADPARAWPVVIDPTAVLQGEPAAGKDAYVNSQADNTNYGADAALRVGPFISSTQFHYRSYLQVDLSSIPGGAVIASAQLELYQFDSYGQTITVTLHRVLAAWLELTITWNTKPAHDATIVSSLDVTTTSGWKTWGGLASLVQAWLTGIYSDYGIVLAVGVSGSHAKHFRSSDYATDPTQQPKWTIVYSRPPAATLLQPTGTQVEPTVFGNTVQPAVQWSYSDPESDPQAKYQVEGFDGQGNLVHSSGEVSSSVTAYAVPAGVLHYAEVYRVRVRVHDGTSWSAWAEAWLRCDLSEPELALTPEPAAARIRTVSTITADGLAGALLYRGLTASGLSPHSLTLVPLVAFRQNILSRPESDLEGGLGGWVPKGDVPIARDTSKASEGLASLHVVCRDIIHYRGAKTGLHAVETGRQYVASAYVCGSGPVRIAIERESGQWLAGLDPSYQLTPDFQRIQVACVIPQNVVQVRVVVAQYMASAPAEFWIDQAQLEPSESGQASAWLPGGMAELVATFYDDVAACGQAYYYAASAVALDGFESALSTEALQEVTFVGTWLDSLRLSMAPASFEVQEEFVGALISSLGRPFPVAFRRQGARRLLLSGTCLGKAEKDALQALLRAPGPHRYVDPLGEALRFEVAGPPRFVQVRPYDPDNLLYEWSAELVEVG